eukprot:3784287-Amphidinium_carterae.1
MKAQGFTGCGFYRAFWPQYLASTEWSFECTLNGLLVNFMSSLAIEIDSTTTLCTTIMHFRTEVLASAPGALYSVAKAVPGFLQVSDLWRWLIDNAVALFSGLRLRK